MKKIVFVANNNTASKGLSGGDRIFIEFIKNWRDKLNISVIGCKECIDLLKRFGVDKNNVVYPSTQKRSRYETFSNIRFLGHELSRIVVSIKAFFKYFSIIKNTDFVYSVSDFWPDILPALLLKLTKPKVKWIAGFYLFAPKPWQKDNPYKTSLPRFFTGLFFWLSQQLSYFFIYQLADFVFVTSEPDVNKFVSKRREKEKIIVIQGGVDISKSHKYLIKKIKNVKKYLGVFMGRLHNQKGVLDLIDIWKMVREKIPGAKLAVIGDGPLKDEMMEKVKLFKIEKNVEFFGYLFGDKKYEIFKKSQIVIHPATYDSGGMAAAEAMAWGLPGVSYDLEALKTYYPGGMVKVKCFDKQEFANKICLLGKDEKLYKKISSDAVDLIETIWPWDKRCEGIFEKVFF